jgi:AraC-like DNA-binding protein
MNNERIADLQQHENCPFYQKKDNPVFEVISHRRGTAVCHKISDAAIIFVIEGEIAFSNRTAAKNEFFMLPARTNFTVEFLESGSLLYLYIQPESDICWRVKQMLFEHSPHIMQQNLSLQTTDRIEKHISLFIALTDNNVQCIKLLKAQILVLLNIICVEYPVDTLAGFFSPLRYCHSKNGVNFKDVVLQNKNKVFKVCELAAATLMSRASFRRKFVRVFGMTPQDWITQERVKYIEFMLKYETIPLNQVAQQAGFFSVREFYGYCKKMFGKTAKEIRKEGKPL